MDGEMDEGTAGPACETPGPAYVARCPDCRRVVGATAADCPRGDIARDTGRWIRAGLEVVRMPVAAVREAEWGHAEACPMAPRPKPRRK